MNTQGEIQKTPMKSKIDKFLKLPAAPKKENTRVPIANAQIAFKPTLDWGRDDVPEEVPRED